MTRARRPATPRTRATAKRKAPARQKKMSAVGADVVAADLLTPFEIELDIGRSIPSDAEVVGTAVGSSGPVPRSLGVSRASLQRSGFTGAVGQTLVVPAQSGPVQVAVGIGEPKQVTVDVLRNAAALFMRNPAVASASRVATTLADVESVGGRAAGVAVIEGLALASYRYRGLRSSVEQPALRSIHLIVGAGRAASVETGARRGLAIAAAARLARDLANTPPAHLNARDFAQLAVDIASDAGLEVEVFDRDQLEAMGCGGILSVNKASIEPPRLVKLSYQPSRRGGASHIALVGKGVMYDSGGLSLKPSDGMHQVMKMDMSGAAAVLATMSALSALRCPNRVTGWMVCTDNMPSGSAMKLGDVLTIRDGTTVEVLNTDAEGRLILADGLSRAAEEAPDAIVDIATLTGAAMAALGPEIAAVFGTDQELVDRIAASAERTAEPVWQLPLAADRYRKLLDSNVADMKNIGGPYAGAITAAIFLSGFAGSVPWAHLDIAGPMKVDADDRWWSKGATGFGARLLIDLVTAW